MEEIQRGHRVINKIRARGRDRNSQPLKWGHNGKDIPGNQASLRQRAEAALGREPLLIERMPVEQIHGLVHELHVHQIELEMQNEELRQTQEALRIALDRYFDLFNLAPVGYLMLSEKGVILEANQAAAELLGLEQRQLKHLPLTNFIFRDDQDIFYLQRKQGLKEKTRCAFELRMVNQEDQLIDVQMECVRIDDQKPESQMRVMLSDISERKRQDFELRRSMERLAISNRRLEDFTSVASHDLQEPIRKIKVFGEFLARDYGSLIDEKGLDYLDRMRRAADRMENLIRDLLELSKLSTQSTVFQTIDLRLILSEVLNDLESQINQTGAQVEVGALTSLVAEPTLMEQLFSNLIGNAIKYHQPGTPPLIKIEAEPVNTGWVEIRVADNGIGFEQKDAVRIFDPFVRLHSKSEYDGTGIGLAICRRIVENHAGHISAYSAPGQGTMFIIQLPVEQPDDVER